MRETGDRAGDLVPPATLQPLVPTAREVSTSFMSVEIEARNDRSFAEKCVMAIMYRRVVKFVDCIR